MGGYSAHTIAYHAESKTRNWWNVHGSDINYCVKGQRFDFITPHVCDVNAGERLMGFKKLRVTKGGANEIVFER